MKDVKEVNYVLSGDTEVTTNNLEERQYTEQMSTIGHSENNATLSLSGKKKKLS